MVNEINEKISEKIKEIKDKSMKEFLDEVINLEFMHSSEAKWAFREEYEKKIKEALK